MRFSTLALGAALTTLAATAGAQVAAPQGTARNADAEWAFALTAYPTIVRGGANYTSAIATADRGALHLEARYNYEAVGARSAFIGWNFSGGDEFTWELTPMVGGAWGATRALVPGLEASFAWKRLDFYTEAEYVRDRNERGSSYFYSWSELGYKPLDWLRVGAVAQRTRAYGGDRSIQPGPFAQVTWRRFTVGGYWFNPGSDDQVVVVSIGASF
ncbi:hypothetical protein [Variovorax sp. OV329]|uniref:hypothetical protein n=1 Tax=Variovorax sp. OV329 TaxID=1882825 RepID=UPI0008F3783F|nr:hypothetical protein [Variovorax sp. OV329]SFN51195.1 hypothetical protein SAMN05444747_13212 [Variovorax sp. OV329]